MHTFVLQDWTTIRGSGSGAGQTIIQAERDWLDLPPFQDAFFWVSVAEVLGANVALFLDTSPTEDESLFSSMTGSTAAVPALMASATPVIVKLPMVYATVPLARYLRWRLTGPNSTWDATFRIVVAVNSPGM